MVSNQGREPLIRLRGINYAYPGEPPVLEALDFDMYRGDRIGLLAPNGSGKTTLFHLIMGLLTPDAGQIEIFGRAVESEKDFIKVRQKIGLLFQDADDQLFSPTVIEDVAFGPLNLGKSKKEALEISRRVLSFLGLSGFEDRITFKLSGGEKKLVSLATVLSMEPEVLLLDEPLTGLDIKTRAKLREVLQSIEMSYMAISHDIDFLTEATQAVYTMAEGKILEDKEFHFHQHEHAHPLGNLPHRHK